MMKADVLSIFPTIKVCTKYQLADGTTTEMLPYELIHGRITPIYEELPGWNVNLKGLESDNLPEALNQYIDFLEKHLQVPITMISTGPDRKQTIFRPVSVV